jgi:hypothetical protein
MYLFSYPTHLEASGDNPPISPNNVIVKVIMTKLTIPLKRNKKLQNFQYIQSHACMALKII